MAFAPLPLEKGSDMYVAGMTQGTESEKALYFAIEAIREASGISVEQFAAQARISPTTWRHLLECAAHATTEMPSISLCAIQRAITALGFALYWSLGPIETEESPLAPGRHAGCGSPHPR